MARYIDYYPRTRGASAHISSGRAHYIIERSPAPIYIRERAIVEHYHYHYHDASRKRHSYDHREHEHRFRELRQELAEVRKEKQIVDEGKKAARDWLEYKELDKESKELGEKIRWYERKLDAAWKKAIGRD